MADIWSPEEKASGAQRPRPVAAREEDQALDFFRWHWTSMTLFAGDVLGQNRDHLPRHAKIYRNFAAEFDRLQAERVSAFREFRNDVATGAYPEPKRLLGIPQPELHRFRDLLDET